MTEKAEITEKTVAIPTPDGAMHTFAAWPEDREPRAAVVVLMDGRGMREALRGEARRLAHEGYYVLLPNLYYRSFPAGDAGEIVGEPDLDTMRAYAAPLTRRAAAADVAACLAYAGGERPVAARKVGLIGYCMGGRLAVGVAHEMGPRIDAVSALHPGSMATRQPESPHLFLQGIAAPIYFAIPEHDPFLSPGAVARLREALDRTGVRYELEVLAGAGHGFALTDRDSYREEDASHAWHKTLKLFASALG